MGFHAIQLGMAAGWQYEVLIMLSAGLRAWDSGSDGLGFRV